MGALEVQTNYVEMKNNGKKLRKHTFKKLQRYKKKKRISLNITRVIIQDFGKCTFTKIAELRLNVAKEHGGFIERLGQFILESLKNLTV